MNNHYLSYVLGFAMLGFPSFGISQTVLTGDHIIEPGVTDSGSLTVSGGVLVEGGDVHLGALANGYAPLVLHYMENGSARQMVVYASQSSVEYLWKEGNGNPAQAKTKMSLGADNTLSLYDASGTPTITLSPFSGEINVNGKIGASGGILLPDSTLISGSESLRSTALYNTAGQVIAEVNEDGVLLIKGGIAAGYYAAATGDGAFAFGETASASGIQSFAAGAYSSATGLASFVGGGDSNSATGMSSAIVGGLSNSAHADFSFVAGGTGNNTFGWGSAVMGGAQNWSFGWGSISLGGQFNRASGQSSFVSGEFSRAQAAYSFVIGSGNVVQGNSTNWIPTDDLFVIGNSSSQAWEDEDRSNAFVVHKNGATRSAGLIESKLGVRVPPSGDIPMGAFTAGANPAALGAGLRYAGE